MSRKPVLTGVPESDKQVRRRARRTQMSVAERLLKGYLFFCYVYLCMPLISGIDYWVCSLLEFKVPLLTELCFLLTCPAEFACSICQEVIKEPLTTPCAHNFCKTCLLGAYDSQSSMRERSRGGRTLWAQKIVKKCPSCPTDICDFLVNPQVQLIEI